MHVFIIVGSTEILLRSSAQGLSTSKMLGQRFGGDGDFFGVAYNGDKAIHACGCGERPLAEMKGKEVCSVVRVLLSLYIQYCILVCICITVMCVCVYVYTCLYI